MSPLQTMIAAHRRGHSVGMASVCCSQPQVLAAAMQVAHDFDTPLLIESTSNQVDQFGGYTGMTPKAYFDTVHAQARARGFAAERLVLGGDHLGPNAWQHLPATQAMEHARVLIAAYAAAGFHKIHLDCSMACADDPVRLPDETVAERSADLARVAEHAAEQAGHPPPVYVIGTEVPIPGGEAALGAGVAVTGPQAAAHTFEVHRQAFAALGLRSAWLRVIAMVVQPGVDFDHSGVQQYDAPAAQALSAFVAAQPGLVFEAHSTDYQTEASLHALVHDHFAILKVGPAATFALREAWFALEAIERELLPASVCSNLADALERRMLAEPRHWQKHYGGDAALQRLLRRFAFSDRSRYYWGDAEVQKALAVLTANLSGIKIPLPLLSQHLPRQYQAALEGRLAATPVALAQQGVYEVLAGYARATTRNRHALSLDNQPSIA